MKKQHTNEQIARAIQREQVITYKKKTTNKSQKEYRDDDESDSVPSLKSGVFSDDSVRFHKKIAHLPQLNRDKLTLKYFRKKIFTKSLLPQPKQINNYFEKEVRQHDNLVLKQKNNSLSTENMKLKTKIMNLEKEVARLSKNLQEDQTKIKTKPGFIIKDGRGKATQIMSLKMTIRNLRKQVDDQKKQNQKIKWSIKFTTISELQAERQAILEETVRLRKMLDEQQMKKAQLKLKEQGPNLLEQKLMNLKKQNLQLNSKLRKAEGSLKKDKQTTDNEKNLSKMLFNARRTIKEKQKQIEEYKSHAKTEKTIGRDEGSEKQINSSKDIQRTPIINRNKKSREIEKRVMSKSAQKYRNTPQLKKDCEKCEKLLGENKKLLKENNELKTLLEEYKDIKLTKLGDFRKEEIEVPTKQQSSQLIRFLSFRFKAHHLAITEAFKYLVNSEDITKNMQETITLAQMADYLVAQPFSVVSSRYLQCFLALLFYPNLKQGTKFQLDEGKKMTKQALIKNFEKKMMVYEVMQQTKEEQMFIQVAQLVTNYHQHILTALNRKRSGQGTIEEKDLIEFFTQIQLQKQFIDFIITQIILESLDLQNLNYYAMFEIFYMPPQAEPEQVPNTKKFQLDHNQIVKEEDQQYEQSRSHLQKQKTQSQKQQQDEYGSKEYVKREMKEPEEEYEQLFQEDKLNRSGDKDETKPNHVDEYVEEYEELQAE